jgi:hypothetical protein
MFIIMGMSDVFGAGKAGFDQGKACLHEKNQEPCQQKP